MPSEMGFQVARFAVYFPASRDVANVLFGFVWLRLLSGDAVRTLAPTAPTRHSNLLRRYGLRRWHGDGVGVRGVDVRLLSRR